MYHKAKRILTLLMVAAMVLSLPVIGASAEELDLTKPVKVSFTKGPSGFAGDFGEAEGKANVVVDLYKVASAILEKDAVPAQTSHGSMYVFTGDTYSIGVPTSYDAMKSADWTALAQKAAQAVLLQGGSPRTAAPAGVISEATAAAGLDPGLYLVVARGSAFTTPDKYVKMDGANLTTIAESDEFTYIYNPELIAVPSTLSSMGIDQGDHVDYDTFKDPDDIEHQGASTAGGNWQYAITALLKPTRTERLGNLAITKDLPAIDENGAATFIFHVHAEKASTGFTYDVDIGITLTGSGTKTYELKHIIPVGATVTVTEEYDGTRFTPDGGDKRGGTIPPVKDAKGNEQALSLTFKNIFNGNVITGYGIENRFVAEEHNGVFTWQFYENADPVIDGQPAEGAVS